MMQLALSKQFNQYPKTKETWCSVVVNIHFFCMGENLVLHLEGLLRHIRVLVDLTLI